MEKPFSPSTDSPFKAENYYMQIQVARLICKRPQPSADYRFTFSIFRGRPQER
jgi:hypothetical protein